MCQEALTLHSTTVTQERETSRYPQFKDDKLRKAPDLGTQHCHQAVMFIRWGVHQRPQQGWCVKSYEKPDQ